MDNKSENKNWLDRSFSSIFKPNLETLIFGIIIAFAVFSRLYKLGVRVMSHDEINHVYFAWNDLYRNITYTHHPLSHGPLQFHLLGFFYFLFGDNDFSARLHAVVFSIGTILFLWKYRRYLGRTGTIVTSILYLISPFMLFYGRYARNDALTIFFGIVSVWSVLRYLDTGHNRYLFLLSAMSALHFSTKETAFIFTAQLLIFLGILFIYRVSQKSWKNLKFRQIFFVLLIITFILLAFAVGFGLRDKQSSTQETVPIPSTEIITEEEPTLEEGLTFTSPLFSIRLFGKLIGVSIVILIAISAVIVFTVAFVLLIIGFGWDKLREDRAFGLILLQFTLIIPQLAGLPIALLDLPITVSDTTEAEIIINILWVIIPMILIPAVVGILWKPREWLTSAGLFNGIYIFFYTTIFTNVLPGIYTGLAGSLGYWLGQQAVQRGDQPWYYFLLIQIPIYEYLAAIGTLIVAGFGISWIIRRIFNVESTKIELMESNETGELSEQAGEFHLVSIGLFYSATSLGAYIVAGEKMPWLTVHMVWSMLLITGWLIGKVIDAFDWKMFKENKGGILLLLFITLITSLSGVFTGILDSDSAMPFQGKELKELQATSSFIIGILVIFVCIGLIINYLRSWKIIEVIRLGLIVIFSFLGVLTLRTSILTSYVNYDYPTEYLVYAHGARGNTYVFEQIEEISERITGGKYLQIAYDNHAAYPFWWYLRDYPNQLQYGESAPEDLRNYDIILVGEENYSKIEPIVGKGYIMFEYQRMVWPNQDYIYQIDDYINYLKNKETRLPMLKASFEIWLNHNFEPYGQVTQKDMSLQNWTPSNKMRMYVRNDIAAKIWEFGGSDIDPYEKISINLLPAKTFDDLGLLRPRDIAVANDGKIYIADTENHRILHISIDGTILSEWTAEGNKNAELDPLGFNQPWGIAVDQEGYVYVTDTWNHRILKYTSDGEFITTWGYFNNVPEDPYGMWGPRDVVIDLDGNVLVTDTGNKRILVFDSDGNFITQIGGDGYQLGQFKEPVGLGIAPDTGDLYVADTWNQRIQLIKKVGVAQYTPYTSWDILSWYGGSLDNKPYLSIDEFSRVFAADPEGGRVLMFSNMGEFLGHWGTPKQNFEGFGIIGGLATDGQGGIWVTDASKNRIFYFALPAP